MPKKNKIVYKYEGGTGQRTSDPMFEKLHLCHLPDLDWEVPVSNEITWGRPLSEEEIERMNAALGIPHGQDVIDRMHAVWGRDDIPHGQA